MSAKAMDETSTRMTWVKVLLVALLVAIPAFMLGPIIWPPAEGSPSPTATQLPFLLFLNGAGYGPGVGVSFLALGLPVMRRVSPDSKVRAWAIYLSIGYLMISWWPHINLHVHNGPHNLQGLIFIDYLFHLPSMVAALILALCFFSLLWERSGSGHL